MFCWFSSAKFVTQWESRSLDDVQNFWYKVWNPNKVDWFKWKPSQLTFEFTKFRTYKASVELPTLRLEVLEFFTELLAEVILLKLRFLQKVATGRCHRVIGGNRRVRAFASEFLAYRPVLYLRSACWIFRRTIVRPTMTLPNAGKHRLSTNPTDRQFTCWKRIQILI